MLDEMFRKLSQEESAEFRKYVDEDKYIQDFIKKVKFFHPVVRDEICKRLK